MNKIYDIRDQMPKFAANFFPPYEREGKDYPKMMINPETKKPYLDKAKNIIVVQDEHEEKLFLAQHYKPETPKSIDVLVANADLPVAQVEQRLAEADTPAKRGPGRPPMPKTLTA